MIKVGWFRQPLMGKKSPRFGGDFCYLGNSLINC